MTPGPAVSAVGRFVVVLALGGAVWLWLRAPVASAFAVVLDLLLGAFGGPAFDRASGAGEIVVIQTRLLTPDGASLLLGRIEPAHFTLAVPLVWAAVVALTPPRAWARWLSLGTLIVLGFCLAAVLLQAGVAIPRLGVRAGAVALQGGTPLEPTISPWSPPSPDLLSALDAFRIALVHFNLFVLPAIIAALSARAPAAPAVAPQPSEVARTSKRNRHDRRRRR